MYRHVIMQSNDNYEVYVDLIKSSAGQYLSRQPYVIKLVKEVLSPMTLARPTVTIEHDMGRIIGNSDIIETTENDTIFYAQPTKKIIFLRFAKNRNPAPSKTLSLKLIKDDAGNYELTETWIGPNVPPFPGDDNATKNSRIFWDRHALVQDTQDIQSKSITKICPY